MGRNEHYERSRVEVFDMTFLRVNCLVMVVFGSEVLLSQVRDNELDARNLFDSIKKAAQSDAHGLLFALGNWKRRQGSDSRLLASILSKVTQGSDKQESPAIIESAEFKITGMYTYLRLEIGDQTYEMGSSNREVFACQMTKEQLADIIKMAEDNLTRMTAASIVGPVRVAQCQELINCLKSELSIRD